MERLTCQNYNVRDQFKPLTKEEVREKLNCTKIPCSVLMQNLDHDLNIGNIIRSANNFNLRNIFYWGERHIDRRGACGAYHYNPAKHISGFYELAELKNKFSFVAVENNVSGSKDIRLFNWETKREPLILIGEERLGLSTELLNLADHIVEIPSLGSIRSLNAASAFSIVAYDFVLKKMMR